MVIENQYGGTDYDHLGKLITYAAGREAGVLVWFAIQFQEAHEAALQWLNDITGPEMAFYGVRLEILKIDDSNPHPCIPSKFDSLVKTRFEEVPAL